MDSPQDELSDWSVPPTGYEMNMDFELLRTYGTDRDYGTDNANPTTTGAGPLDFSLTNTAVHPPPPSFPLASLPFYQSPPPAAVPTTNHHDALAPYLRTLVTTHGCIRQNLRCSRQLQDYWLPTLPSALRGAHIESVMRDCVRLGRRTYVSREERRCADDKWAAYCTVREGDERRRAALAVPGEGPALTPAAPPEVQQLFSPPPILNMNLLQQSQQSKTPTPKSPHERRIFIVMAPYNDLRHLQERWEVVGVVGEV